ncbi:hypothetical protein [Pseudoalteromonas sp. PS5]|uniref:hypothetical protein n=1 Tax=Pseudoalteromonas sp. PS5 TaxID=1437473 RepID=UPI000FFED5B0|nr:hypothetical protein [Pseudoalteromonas sp. PS5]RXF00411.1 hypothetical protein D9603_15310 [Pseudoalteromonas sp. PS5]
MKEKSLKAGEWITIGDSIDGYIFSVISDAELMIGYMQNGIKPIKEKVVLSEGRWIFESSGPSGSYLREVEAAILKRGR